MKPLLLTVLLAASASAQAPGEAPSSTGGKLVVELSRMGDESSAAPRTIDPDVLTVGLSIDDLDVREAFYDGLMADAKRSPQRHTELMFWLEDVAGGRGELAWTARLAKRELGRPIGSDPLLAFSGGPMVGAFGQVVDPQAWTLFLAQPADGRLMVEGQAPADASQGAGSDLQLEAWVERAMAQDNRFPVASLDALGDCTLELRIGPTWAQLRLLDAPVLQLTPEDDSAGHEHQTWTTRVREFSGRDLAEIVRRNPDLVGMLPFEVPGLGAGSVSPRTDVLGVWTQPLTDEHCSALGLPPGCGLEVGRVEPGTVAEVLGISPGSVVLEVCGIEVRGNVGIADAMHGAKEHHVEDGMCVVWIDAFGRSHQRTWRRGMGLAPKAAEPVERTEPNKLRPVDR
ncbi:MAG: hypothetical protein P1V81_12905 [Planctomycetota bacterium]|nr:hypothetical protein [Planctomycetota bacterium]